VSEIKFFNEKLLIQFANILAQKTDESCNKPRMIQTLDLKIVTIKITGVSPLKQP